MILILSDTNREVSTESVMDWLDAYDVPHARLNGQDVDGDGAFTLTVSGDGVSLHTGGAAPSIDPDDVEVVWYRRWKHGARHQNIDLIRAEASDQAMHAVDRALDDVVKRELSDVSDAVFDVFGAKTWLGDPTRSRPNKLRVLQAAADAGLDVPETIVTDDRAALRTFAESNGPLITKAIGDARFLAFEDGAYAPYTASIETSDVKALPERFFPSLFQERLDKAYEVRVFYLGGECYSMAIFSQDDEQTEVDFRRYNHQTPNRKVPYDLPETVANCVRTLMDRLDLDTGSIDLVRTTNGRFVFLEVNPVGQFGMVSRPCNYPLERRVAEHLINAQSETDDASTVTRAAAVGDGSHTEPPDV